MSTDSIQFDLFSNTPFFERWRHIGLGKCIGVLILITWMPLIFLSTFYKPEVFLTDLSLHMKFFVALPLLFLAPLSIKNKLGDLVNHFIRSDIIKRTDHVKFISYVDSTLFWRSSKCAKLIIWILIYASMIYMVSHVTPEHAASWRLDESGSFLKLSPAGIWFSFVAQPVYSFVQFYFIYRVLLWFRLLVLISRLDLQLNASHGDDTGGLIFIGGSLKIFYIPVLAFSASVAIGVLNLVLNKNFDISELKVVGFVLIGFNFFVFVFPLFFFYGPLMKAKHYAILNYGALGGHQLLQFDAKWLLNDKVSLLESNDFSTVTDTASIVNKVYKMRSLPFSRNVFIGLMLCTVFPFLPVLAVKLEWSVIFNQLVKVLI